MLSYPNPRPNVGFAMDKSALALGHHQSTMYSDHSLFDQKFPNESDFLHHTYDGDQIMDENVYDLFERPNFDQHEFMENRALQELPLYQLHDMQNRPSYNNHVN